MQGENGCRVSLSIRYAEGFFIQCGCTYTVDLLNPQIFGKNDLYIDYCLFLNPFYVFLFVIIFVESHLTSDCF